MSELLSMVVPLQTLPGWPVAPPVTWLHGLGLLFGLPICVIVIIVVIGKVGHRIHQSRGGNHYDDTVATRAAQAQPLDGSGGRAALTAEQSGQRSTESSVGSDRETPVEASKVGGARARW